MTPPIFEKLPSDLNFPRDEHEVLSFWKSRGIFEKSLSQRAGAPSFVFYEGPPTANGLPHNGHVLTRVVKDLFPRYKAMRGYYVPRKAGWDTHGLPVEVEVEKELGLHGKAAIEQYGIEPFISKCVESVFRYTDEWERLTDRIGFWVDLQSAYVTYHKSYVESVWWTLSELFKKGLLYQGHKVVWWWAQGGTALSAAEVGQGYKQVDDPSVFVAFPLTSEPDVSLLVWTTTPWTLPSNAYAAVNPEHDYVRASIGARRLIVAKALLPQISKQLKAEAVIEREFKGKELVGLTYVPPFDFYHRELASTAVKTKSGESLPIYWRVIAADFVTLDAGTGIVHVAPAFGEDDFQAHRRELARLSDPLSVPLLCAVNPDGTFLAEVNKYGGRWVKDCDKEIQHELRDRGLLVHAETYRHDYPFCWRSDNDPLIQYARPAWYIRTTAVIEKAIANNQAIEWLPPHIKNGRFGDFLDNNVDWALSRERYWGTPLNVWVNDVSGKLEAPGSVAEILAKNPLAFDHFYEAKKADPSLNEHLIVHKPWVDAVTWENHGEPGVYRRVPDVIDCWFDTGCMPYAQWGFPHQGGDIFKKNFPSDFISEAIDQTRGWFYSLLMVSTLLFDDETQKRLGLSDGKGGPVPFPYPFKTCIVLGHVADTEGKKESKSKGNYTSPEVILDRVRTEFAVVDASIDPAIVPADGVAWICREDLEGLDLKDGATVTTYRSDSSERHTVTLRAAKKLRRRVIVLSPNDRSTLGVICTSNPTVKPASVPWLPQNERVEIEDTTSPAPGADAFRWFFYASNPPWNSTRHSLANVRALQKEFLVKVRNVFSFFNIYANIDGFDPYSHEFSAISERSELDRWVMSELESLVLAVTRDLDGYDVYAATQRLATFVDALSNWYVRRSRERFWRSAFDTDKRQAYETLYTCLVTLSRVAAPFVPFIAESLHQNLVVGPARKHNKQVKESVHLEDFPVANEAAIDAALSTKIGAIRALVSLGLQVRTQHTLKVRQPLRAAHLIVANDALRASLRSSIAECHAMIREELNVLAVDDVPNESVAKYVEYKLKPNFRTLGERGLGKDAQRLKGSMAKLATREAAEMWGRLADGETITFDGVALTQPDVEIAFQAHEGFAAAGDRIGVVVIETELDDELRDLALFRELQYRIQTERKERGFEYTDRIDVTLAAGDRVREIVSKRLGDLKTGVLAENVKFAAIEGEAKEFVVEGETVRMAVVRRS